MAIINTNQSGDSDGERPTTQYIACIKIGNRPSLFRSNILCISNGVLSTTIYGSFTKIEKTFSKCTHLGECYDVFEKVIRLAYFELCKVC